MDKKYEEETLKKSIYSDVKIPASKRKTGKNGRAKNYYAKRFIALGMALGIVTGVSANVLADKIDNKIDEISASKTLTLNRTNAVNQNKHYNSEFNPNSYWYKHSDIVKQIIEESLQSGRSMHLYIYDCLMAYETNKEEQMVDMFSYLSKEMNKYMEANKYFEYDYDFQLIANCPNFEEYCKTFGLAVLNENYRFDYEKTFENIRVRAQAIQMADFAREDARKQFLKAQREYDKLICPATEKVDELVQKLS